MSTRDEFVFVVGSVQAAKDFERSVLQNDDDGLPECMREVKAGREPTPAYWDWLINLYRVISNLDQETADRWIAEESEQAGSPRTFGVQDAAKVVSGVARDLKRLASEGCRPEVLAPLSQRLLIAAYQVECLLRMAGLEKK